jgi:hypothetical protein
MHTRAYSREKKENAHVVFVYRSERIREVHQGGNVPTMGLVVYFSLFVVADYEIAVGEKTNNLA